MTKEITLPKPDTHCFDDDAHPPVDVWSYSPELVRQIIESDRAQRGEPVAWAMPRKDGLLLDVITPEEHEAFEGDYTIPLYTDPQPSQPERKPHTEQDVREIVQTVEYGLGIDRLEFVVRRILGVPKP